MEDFGCAKREWLETFLDLDNGIPSHDTFNRLFAALDPGKILECFLAWTQSLRQAVDKEIVAMDGKALRGALGKYESMKYIVSAWAEDNDLVLGQLKVVEKSNEIPVVPELLRVLELEGCTVTLDAMGCQKEIAKEIIEAGADYVVLDVQLREDESRARTGNAPENLATLRRLTLNLLKKESSKKRGIRGRQLNAGWNQTYLLRLLSI